MKSRNEIAKHINIVQIWLESHIDYMNNLKGNMHILMLVVNGIAGINFEHPIIQKRMLSL